MRIIDRYVFSSFIRNYLISFMVLIGMYVVLDMVFHFDELSRFYPDFRHLKRLLFAIDLRKMVNLKL